MISYYSTYALPHPLFNAAVAEGYSIFETIINESAEKVTVDVWAYADQAAMPHLQHVKIVLGEEFTPAAFEKIKPLLLAYSKQINAEGEPI